MVRIRFGVYADDRRPARGREERKRSGVSLFVRLLKGSEVTAELWKGAEDRGSNKETHYRRLRLFNRLAP